jgi:hypothetical protein
MWAFGLGGQAGGASHHRLGDDVKTIKLCARQFLKVRDEKINRVTREI